MNSVALRASAGVSGGVLNTVHDTTGGADELCLSMIRQSAPIMIPTNAEVEFATFALISVNHKRELSVVAIKATSSD